jgi:hypothetical protein
MTFCEDEMTNKHEITKLLGIEEGAIDPKNGYVSFKAKLDRRPDQWFATKANVLEQILSTLGTLLRQLKEHTAVPAAEAISAIEVGQYGVQKDPFHDKVLMKIISPVGIPYTFAIPTSAVGEMSERLKTEGSKPTVFGSA